MEEEIKVKKLEMSLLVQAMILNIFLNGIKIAFNVLLYQCMHLGSYKNLLLTFGKFYSNNHCKT